MSLLSNFTVSDLIGTWIGFLLFPLFLVAPGYLCGWLFDMLGFRNRSHLCRLAISVTLSIGLSPILTYMFWRWSPIAGWSLFVFIWMGFVVVLVYDRGTFISRLTLSKQRGAILAITVGWIVLGIFCLVDLQYKNKLYFSDLAYDYTFRSAVAASIARSGVPPSNPYFFPGKPVVLRYHYFWSILCSLASQLGGTRVSPRQAVMAGTLWSGLGLIAVVPLWLRFFEIKGPNRLDRRIAIALGLLTVTGINILPVALLALLARTVSLTNTAVLPWLGDVLWAPHHVAALVACLTGFLILRHHRASLTARSNALTCTGAGMMFASALGLSIYVTFVFAVSLTTWIIVCCLNKQYREAGRIALAGVLALALSLPYLFELLSGNSNRGVGGGSFLQFTIRGFPVPEALLSPMHPVRLWVAPLVNALLLPVNYFLELGFFFGVGVVQWKRMQASRRIFSHPDLCGFVIVATTVFLCSFFRSGVIAANDLGVKGFMPAQFVLLIWGAELIDSGLLSRRVDDVAGQATQSPVSLNRRKIWIAALALGLAGTLNDLFVMRSLPILGDVTQIRRPSWLSPDHNLGVRTYALRHLYEDLKVELPTSAVLQHNPDTDPADLFHGLYADRQLAVETLGCGTVFGGDPASCRQMIGPIRDLFENPAADSTQVRSVCRAFSINALIVKDTDPVWADKSTWVWQNKPLLADRYSRAFLCSLIR